MKIKKLALAALTGLLVMTACKDDKEGGTPPPANEDYTGLVLNEICGKQNPDNDWIEILNTTTRSIDLGGVQLKKIDEEGVSEVFYTFPAGATIAAGTYEVLNQLDGDFTVGISNSKQVGIVLLSPSGTTIDDFDRDADLGTDASHTTGGSYARMPNGIGTWSVVRSCTPGAVNHDEEPVGPTIPDGDYTGIVLNEVCGGSAVDDADDWVEILNTSSVMVDLSGVQIFKTDENNVTETIYAAPEGTSLAAGAYLVLRKNAGELDAKISNTKPVVIALMSPSGNVTIDKFDQMADIAAGTGILDQNGVNGERGHALGGSYARVPNATGGWKVMTAPTPGASNDGSEPEPDPDYSELAASLVLNELNGNDPKYIELYNKSDQALDIAGVIIRKDGKSAAVYVAPAGTTIAAHSFLLLLADQPSYETGFTSGLSAKKSVKIELFAPDGTTSIDLFKNLMNDGSETWGEKPKYNGETNGQSYARYPDGTGDWYLTTPTQDAANTQGAAADKITW